MHEVYLEGRKSSSETDRLAFSGLDQMGELMAAGKLAPRVTERYPLDQYVDAFGAITGRRALGKVVLTMT